METKKTEKKEIYSALIKVINDMQNPKNSVDNPYFNSKYVPLSDILDIAKPILKQNGLAIIQTPEITYEQKQTFGKNNQVYTNEIGVVTVTTTLLHEKGETLDFPPMIFKASGNTPQHIGSAITYGRRYSLTSILGIAGKEEDDDGNNANVPLDNQYQNNYQNDNQQYGNQNNYQDNGSVQSQPQSQITQNTNQHQQNNSQPQPKSLDLQHHKAIVRNIKHGTSGGSKKPYIELTLEQNGALLTAFIKDENVLEIAKGLEQDQEAYFKILSSDDFHFVTDIKLEGVNAE